MFRRLVLGSMAVLALAGAAAAAPYARVDVAPTRTSIYVGVVSMTMPTFVREGQAYTASYAASVVPLFFYNEKGTLRIDFSDAQLAQLARGETVEFTGRARRDDGVERPVTGRATPSAKDSGKLKVRVEISRQIQLIFNTTYRFEP